MSRAPSNLLQWLRLREMRPVQLGSLPVRLMKNQLRSSTIRLKAKIYVWVMAILTQIRLEMQLQKRYSLIMSRFVRLWGKMIYPSPYQHHYWNSALKNGLLMVIRSFVEIIYSPLQFDSMTIWIRQSAILFLRHFARMMYMHKFARHEYRAEFIRVLEFLMCSPYSLTSALDILKLEHEFPDTLQEEVLELIHLEGPLHQRKDTFYFLFTKLKEIMHYILLSHKGKKYLYLLTTDGVIEKVVHEAYCTAICLESLLRQQVTAKRIDQLFSASFKIKELLCLINGLFVLYEDYRDECFNCCYMAERIINAGLPRLIHVLTTILFNGPEHSLDFIDAFADNFIELINFVTELMVRITRGSCYVLYRVELWYTMYTVSDIDRMINYCSELWATKREAVECRDMLLNVRRTVSNISPPEYILDPIFHNIPFELNREVPLHEPFLTLRKLCHSNEYRFKSFQSCLRSVLLKIVETWPDKSYD